MAGSLRLTLCLLAVGGEMAGIAARWVWRKTSRRGRLHQQLERLERAGTLTMAGTGPIDQRIIRLTAVGRHAMLGDVDPPALWARPWDGIWRIVAFDVPQTHSATRERLRRRLHHLRFGWLQNSVWISPDPLTDLRTSWGDVATTPESFSLFNATPAGGELPEALVTSAWDFARLGKSHTNYLAMLRLRPGRLTGTAAAWLHWLELEHRAWLQIVDRDPFLPAALLPQDYQGREVWVAREEAFRDFSQSFASVLRVPPG